MFLGLKLTSVQGMNFEWDLTYIIDGKTGELTIETSLTTLPGMTTVEHALPIPLLYDDVLTLFVESGTSSTPTHLVNYGGVMGEQHIWATEPLPYDLKWVFPMSHTARPDSSRPRLRRFTRHDELEGRIYESTARPKDCEFASPASGKCDDA